MRISLPKKIFTAALLLAVCANLVEATDSNGTVEKDNQEEVGGEPGEKLNIPKTAKEFSNVKMAKRLEGLKEVEGFAKLGSMLTQLYVDHTTNGSAALENQVTSKSLPISSDGEVLVDITSDNHDLELILLEAGLSVEVTGCYKGTACSAYVPIENLVTLTKLSGIKSIKPALFSRNAGSVMSEGAQAMMSDLAREQFGVDGTGLLIGVLSDSYDCARFGVRNDFLTTASDDIATKDLPDDVLVLADLTEKECRFEDGSDEGRAMLQLIHDVAPGAKLAFRTAFRGEADFARGIQELADKGCDIIVDDIGYSSEPFFQDGIIAQAADSVAKHGVPYFSAAGNSGRNSWESANGFINSGESLVIEGIDYGIMHQFGIDDSGEKILGMNLGTFVVNDEKIVEATIILQWDEPFGGLPGAIAGCSNDLDMFLVLQDENGRQIREVAWTPNIGDDPFELLPVVFNSTEIALERDVESFTIFLLIIHAGGPSPGFMKMVESSGSEYNPFFQFPTDSSTSFGHPNAARVAGIGSARFFNTPPFETPIPIINPTSSAGGTPILFDKKGNRLKKAKIRKQPRVVGPDCTRNTFFPICDAEGVCRFCGTSASAPHVAAVAALMMEKNDNLKPSDVYKILESTAIDMNDPSTPEFDDGFDYGTGYGFVDALAALNATDKKDRGSSKSSKYRGSSKSNKRRRLRY